ncbi:MAG: hypothetical protein LBP69_01195, partial [Treponema sp.]|nr:hypothetical protein [Treponema sp.]
FRKKYGLECPPAKTGAPAEAGVFAGANTFTPADETRESEAVRAALPVILTEVSGLDKNDPVDSLVYGGVLHRAGY